MPRTWDTDLQTILQAYKRRDKLDIHLNDGSTLNLSRGNVSGYSNWLSSVSDYSATIDRAVDRIGFTAQNVSSDLGLDLASNLRLLDYAVAEYSKQYQSLRNPALSQDISVFRGVLANAEANEKTFSLEMIVDYESVGATISSRGLSPRCWWTYKNGFECPSVSGLATCPRTREACIIRGVEYAFGGWEFFERPVSTPPQPPRTPSLPCFTLTTPIWLPSGDVPIGDLPLGVLRDPIPAVSFDPVTGEIEHDDEIIHVWEHDAIGYFSFLYGDGRDLNVTPDHRLWLGPFRTQSWKIADEWMLNDTGWKYMSDAWEPIGVRAIRWHSDSSVRVRNLTTRKNHTYFANRIAVSNSKGLEEPL